MNLDRNLQIVEQKLTAAKTEVTKYKLKVDTVLADMQQIGEEIDKNESKLNQL